MQQQDIMAAVLQAVHEKSYTPQPAEWFASLPELSGVKKKELSAAIVELEDQGELVTSKKGRLQTPAQAGYIVGRLEGTSRAFSFLKSEGEGVGDRLFIADRDRGDALHGDRVLCRVIHAAQGDRAAEGEVLQILQRGPGHILGTYRQQGAQGYVTPDDHRYGVEFLVKKGEAATGEKVWMEITRWPRGGSAPQGKIREVLGPSGEFTVNYRAILLQHGIRTDYPEAAEAEAEALRQRGITERDIEGRLDLRGLLTFTIDGIDAKDFDDALSLEELPEGALRLGVHIADVSHYVTEGGLIDQEAEARGTSVYFTDQVVPMLPHALSDDLCSLRPGEDRLTLSCMMTLDAAGAVQEYEIRHSVIHSRARCVYSEVNRLLEGGADAELARRYEEVLPAIRRLLELTRLLTAARRRRGAMTFETLEPKILLDPNGQPENIVAHPRGDAERLVEECMLLANRTVARHLQQRKLPGVYRNHGAPMPDKLNDLGIALEGFGISFAPRPGENPAFALQRVADEAGGTPTEQTVMSLLIRTMSRANYGAQNKGHYGLAEDDYCHFTSPIRRYPDLLVHRAITLAAGKDRAALARLTARAPELAAESFAGEERAVAAERDITDLFKCLYMSRFLGERFSGVVSGVTGFGLFVMLDNTVEGLVHISELDDDYYSFDEAARTLSGRHKGSVYKLGMQVEVTLVKSDPESRRIDFILAGE